MIDARNQDLEDEMQSFQRALLAAAFAATVLSSSPKTMAQEYPNRPITIVVPFPENVTGASGSLGVGRVARSAPDGYMLVLGTLGSHVINGAFMQLQYDIVKDFEPISLVATQPLLIVARKTMPANNLAELIDWLKAN